MGRGRVGVRVRVRVRVRLEMLSRPKTPAWPKLCSAAVPAVGPMMRATPPTRKLSDMNSPG